jgi:3-methyladenine DNA glycosylase AlkC
MAETEAPALKEMFNEARFRSVAKEVSAIHPAFDAKRFLALSLQDLATLSLMQRLRRMTESLHATLPASFPRAVRILRKLVPRIDRGFITLVCPDYVGLYGLGDFETSMDALKFFTPFGSSEFAVREFLRHDLSRALAVMETWSQDKDEHVRRLASEGSRPRLPWSFRLEALIADPSPVVPILENLKADPSLYVRKSVANHLNDITKNHHDWVLDRLASWPLQNPHTAWIAKHALRSLIKKGNQRALHLTGATGKAEVQVPHFTVTPRAIPLGGRLTLSLQLSSTSARTQRLVVDYAVHYVKKSGATSAKVFKWKDLTLAAGESITLSRSQVVRDFTTRVHHPGRHAVDILINGERLAAAFFDLSR